MDEAVIAEVRDQTDQTILRQLGRAEQSKPTRPDLGELWGIKGNHTHTPDDLLSMAAWAEAVGHSGKAIDFLSRAESHLSAHIAWLQGQPRSQHGTDRDREIAVAQFLLERARLHQTDHNARAADALELEVRSTWFGEKKRMAAALAPAFKQAVKTKDADQMRALAIAITEAQGDPDLAAEVAALPIEQFVRYGRILTADEEKAKSSRQSSLDERKDEALIENLFKATEDELMKRRLDDYPGHERLVLAARHVGREPVGLGDSNSYRGTAAGDLKLRLRELHRRLEIAVEAGGRASTEETLRLQPDAMVEMTQTLRANDAAVTLRIVEDYGWGKTTEASLSYQLEARAVVDGQPVSLRFYTPIAESRQQNAADRLKRALAEGRAKKLPTPEPGLWADGEEITGTTVAPAPAAPTLTSISEIIGKEPFCNHLRADWGAVGGSSHRMVLECPNCRRQLAHAPKYSLPDKDLQRLALGDRRELAEKALLHERRLAHLRGEDPPTISTLLGQPRVDASGQIVPISGPVVSSVAAAMNRR